MTFLYVDVCHIESWHCIWHHNDVSSQRLTNGVMWLPIQPLYWQHMLLFFLAHLSQRLTRWAYSIPMVCRPHFQTWISLMPVGQSWSNFTCSIAGVGERQHKVLGQIGSKLWFPWQQKAPMDLKRGNDVATFSLSFFIRFFLYLQVTRTCIKSWNEFKFRPVRTTDYRVSCPWASKKFP